MNLNRFGSGAESPVDDSTSPVQNGGRSKAIRIAYWPGSRKNLTQSILYSEESKFGFQCKPLGLEGKLPSADESRAKIIHLHWLWRVETDALAVEFERLLRRFKDEGRMILWTAHNILPHDTHNVPLAIRVRKIMVEAADAIHIMNDRTPELVEPYFSIRDKTLIKVPHSSYLGAVPNIVSREAARQQLGISPGAKVYLAFGSIRRYKRIEEIIAAARSLAKTRPDTEWVVLVAGAGKGYERLDRAGFDLGDRLRIHYQKVPNENLQVYFNSADYALYAHDRSLNSGSAYMAVTFGVPLIAPDTGAFLPLLADGAGIGYAQDANGALARAMASALDSDPTIFRERALAIAEATRPEVISDQFFTKLREVLAENPRWQRAQTA